VAGLEQLEPGIRQHARQFGRQFRAGQDVVPAGQHQSGLSQLMKPVQRVVTQAGGRGGLEVTAHLKRRTHVVEGQRCQRGQLRDAPVARGALGTLVAATALSVALAVVGLLTALLGGARDERAAVDLAEQGAGPRALRVELRVRLTLATVLGVLAGLGIAVLLTRLAVASVRAAGTVADPVPPVVTVVPWVQLAAWGAGTLAVLALAGVLATRALIRPTPTGSAVR